MFSEPRRGAGYSSRAKRATVYALQSGHTAQNVDLCVAQSGTVTLFIQGSRPLVSRKSIREPERMNNSEANTVEPISRRGTLLGMAGAAAGSIAAVSPINAFSTQSLALPPTTSAVSPFR